MKNIIFLILVLNISCVTKAQVLNRYNNSDYAQISGAYYKDVFNFQNQFVGTWVFQSGNERLEMKFRKIEMMSLNSGLIHYSEDILVGEYKYINSNGVEKVNSLPNLILDHPNFYNYNLYSGPKMEAATHPICHECPEGPRLERLYMFFDEANNDDASLSAAFIMSFTIENGVQKIKAKLIHLDSASNENKTDLNLPSVFRNFSVPYGFYTLIKQ